MYLLFQDMYVLCGQDVLQGYYIIMYVLYYVSLILEQDVFIVFSFSLVYILGLYYGGINIIVFH